MARSEATLSPDTDIYDALRRLLKSRLTGAPVVDDDGTLLGMLTERDCLKVLVGGALDGLPSGKVSDYMTAPAQSISPAASLFDIAHIFPHAVVSQAAGRGWGRPRDRAGEST